MYLDQVKLSDHQLQLRQPRRSPFSELIQVQQRVSLCLGAVRVVLRIPQRVLDHFRREVQWPQEVLDLVLLRLHRLLQNPQVYFSLGSIKVS